MHRESTDEMSQSQSPRSRHWEIRAFGERLPGELLSASEHILLMGRCYTPIKSAIRGSMNHLVEHREACATYVATEDPFRKIMFMLQSKSSPHVDSYHWGNEVSPEGIDEAIQ